MDNPFLSRSLPLEESRPVSNEAITEVFTEAITKAITLLVARRLDDAAIQNEALSEALVLALSKIDGLIGELDNIARRGVIKVCWRDKRLISLDDPKLMPRLLKRQQSARANEQIGVVSSAEAKDIANEEKRQSKATNFNECLKIYLQLLERKNPTNKTSPKKQSIICFMRHGLCMSYEEIAEFTGGTPEAVYKTYWDGMKNLKALHNMDQEPARGYKTPQLGTSKNSAFGITKRQSRRTIQQK